MRTQLWIDFQDIDDDGTLELTESSFRIFSNSGFVPGQFHEVLLISPEHSTLHSIVASVEDGVIKLQAFPETLTRAQGLDDDSYRSHGYIALDFKNSSESIINSQLTRTEVANSQTHNRFAST